MPLPEVLQRVPFPVIASPMFIISTPKLVTCIATSLASTSLVDTTISYSGCALPAKSSISLLGSVSLLLSAVRCRVPLTPLSLVLLTLWVA